MYEVLSVKTSNCPGKCDNKVDNLVSALELLTKQVSNLESEIKNIKGDGYKKNVNSDFNSGDRRGRNVISCKNCKDINRTTCSHCFKCGSSNHLARECCKPSSGNQESERDCWIAQPAIKEALPKSITIVKNYYLRNIIVVVVSTMFIFVGESPSLGLGHTTERYVHL